MLSTDLIEETYKLPSRGIPYVKEELPLIGGHSVRIRPYVLGDKRAIDAATRSGSSYQFYTKVLERLIVEPKVESWDSLLISDVLAIMFAVKLRSFGPNYDLAWECESCGLVQQGAYDLRNVSVKEADNKEDFPNGFKARNLEVKLTNMTINMHLPVLRDEKSVEDIVADMAKLNTLQDESIDTMYVRRVVLIDDIDGKPATHVTRFNKLMECTIGDYDLVKDHTKSLDSGIVATIEMVCKDKKCKGATQLGLGLNPDFFRPSTYRSGDRQEQGGASPATPDVL